MHQQVVHADAATVLAAMTAVMMVAAIAVDADTITSKFLNFLFYTFIDTAY